MTTMLPPSLAAGVAREVDISEDMWKKILKLYLITYRGADADTELRAELQNYKVLPRYNASVDRGRFVRYLPKGIVDASLRAGGWVESCNGKCVHLRYGERKWRISRADNFVFVRDEDAPDDVFATKPASKKNMRRLLAEEALRKDNELRQRKRMHFVATADDDSGDDEQEPDAAAARVKLKARIRDDDSFAT